MRQLEQHHRRQRLQHPRDVFGGVGHELRVETVHDADLPVAGLEVIDEGAKRAEVRVEFDLAGAVEDQVVFVAVAVELLPEPLVQMLLEVLETKDQAAVGAEAELLLDVIKGDEVADIAVHGVVELFRRGVEIEDVDGSAWREGERGGYEEGGGR